MEIASSKKPKSIKGVFEHPAGSGIWWINYYVEGTRHREKVGRRSDAVALYQRRKTDARMGIKMPEVRPRRAVLFSEIADDALAYSKEHKASYPGDRSTVKKVLPTFGGTAIEEITPQMIKAYLDSFLHHKFKPSARRNHWLTVPGEADLRGVGVAALMKLLKSVGCRGRENHDPRSSILGLKQEHLPPLKIDPVPLQPVQLTPSHSCFEGEGELRFMQGAPLPDDGPNGRLFRIRDESDPAILFAVKPNQPRRVELRFAVPDSFLEDHRDRSPISVNRRLGQIVSLIKDDPSLKDVTWHIFRHTYISRLVMAGVDIRTVQELAGHKDIKMTMRYAHLAPAHKLAAVDRLVKYRKEQEKAEAKKTSGLRLVSA